MNKKIINEIFSRFKEKNANPKIELEYSSAYTLLIAVVLSAQSTDKGVNRVTPKLFDVADTPAKMVALGLDSLKEHIKTIGLYNNKAKHIIALSQALLDDYAGKVPSNLIDLQKLPGVGRKSANVLLNSMWSHSTIAVDTHVFRVSNRIGLCATKNPLQTELALMKAITKIWQDKAHHWLVLHGRYVCKSRKPNCAQCLINDLCEYDKKVF